MLDDSHRLLGEHGTESLNHGEHGAHGENRLSETQNEARRHWVQSRSMCDPNVSLDECRPHQGAEPDIDRWSFTFVAIGFLRVLRVLWFNYLH